MSSLPKWSYRDIAAIAYEHHLLLDHTVMHGLHTIVQFITWPAYIVQFITWPAYIVEFITWPAYLVQFITWPAYIVQSLHGLHT